VTGDSTSNTPLVKYIPQRVHRPPSRLPRSINRLIVPPIRCTVTSVSPRILIAVGSIHTIRTACPLAVHSSHPLSTRCGCPRCRGPPTVRAVSQTPTYDQLRGERINAEVPPSEYDLPRVGQPGKHGPADDAARVLASGQAPEAASDLQPAWSWFEPTDTGATGRHHPRGAVPGAAELRDRTPGYGMVEPESAGSRNAIRRPESTTGKRLRGETQAPPPAAPQAALPPVAHARHASPHDGKSCPTSADDQRAQDMEMGDPGTHSGHGCQPRSVHRTAARYGMPKAVH
jgi:hypothetical protein